MHPAGAEITHTEINWGFGQPQGEGTLD